MNIYESLAAINKEIKAITKDQKNTQQGFKFRGIDDVMNQLHDLFAKHEVIILPEVLERTREERTNQKGTVIFTTHLTISYCFLAIDGTKVCAIAVGESMDSGDKGCNKAMSVALKMVLLEMFLIPTQEMKDPDSETHEIKAKILSEMFLIPTQEMKDPDSETHEIKAKILSDVGFSKALERIANGEVELIEKLTNAYTLTPAQKKLIEASVPEGRLL